MFQKPLPGMPSGGFLFQVARCADVGAGWSSPVARQAHNLKVAGSNPAPATNQTARLRAAFLLSSIILEVAETEGFEPSVREFPVRRFSKPLVSATHPRLRMRPLRRSSGGYISAISQAST